jgi:FAD:protein FMN transferase
MLNGMVTFIRNPMNQFAFPLIPLFAVLVLATSAVSRAAESAPALASLTGPTMGTTYHIKYWGEGSDSPPQVKQAVDALLAEFDRQMSTYRDDSELSHFNKAPAGEWVGVSRATAHVVSESLRYGEATGGVLDVTVSPLVRLWNFGGAGEKERPLQKPNAAAIAEARRLVGLERVEVRLDPPALKKDLAGVEVDLSSIAPGYAVDLVIDRLQKLGFANAMVEIGGEVRGVGTRPDGRGWRIGVEQVDATDGSLALVAPLDNLALSTAGDYRNFQTADGRRFTHIIDPRNGEALPYRGASVTVVAATCIEADALDTPLLVMGPVHGFRWCEEHDVAAYFQFKGEDGTIDAQATTRFRELIERSSQP